MDSTRVIGCISKTRPPPERKRIPIAERLSKDEMVSFKELIMSNEIYMEALVQLLVDKGVFTKQELLGKIKQVHMEMQKQKGQ